MATNLSSETDHADLNYTSWEELEFTLDDPNETSLVDSTDSVVFSASTAGKGANAVTTYAGEGGAPIAILEGRRFLGDQLTFVEGEKKMAPGKWLKHSKVWEPGQLGEDEYPHFVCEP